MRLIKMFSVIGSVGLLLLAGGCAKKVTKVSVMPQAKAEMPAPYVQPASPPNDSFVVGEADSILKATLKTVYFDFNKSNIRSDATSDLENAGRLLMTRKEVRVLLEGNCDERGSEEYNIGLGQRRADAVKNWLVTYGVGDNRFETTSYGKERPAVPNCQDEACHAKNRRVEFKVLAGPKSFSQNVR